MRPIKLILLMMMLVIGIDIGATDKRTAVADTYMSQLGVREATGQNDGLEVEMYLASTNLGAGYAWCAAFVNWVYKQNDVARPDKGAWSPAWFPNKRLIDTGKHTPQRADLFALYYTNLKRIGHVGFIHEWGTSYVTTVEGNTNNAGSREGDGVYKKRRLTRQIHRVSDWITEHG